MEWFSVLVIKWVEEVDSIFISFVRKISIETILNQIFQLGFGNILLVNLKKDNLQIECRNAENFLGGPVHEAVRLIKALIFYPKR